MTVRSLNEGAIDTTPGLYPIDQVVSASRKIPILLFWMRFPVKKKNV